MLSFANPSYLILLLIIPFLGYYLHFAKRRGGRLMVSFKIWKEKVYSLDPWLPTIIAFIASILFWSGFTFLILSLADPNITKTKKIYLNKGAATIIILDESPSMAARDFGKETRFNSAKIAIERFIKERENDEIGLVTFSKEAVLRVPLTNDYKYLLNVLNKVGIMEMGNGTSVGIGLAMAALHLSKSDSINKNIILITDGANNSGEIHPLSAVEILKNMQIKVFTVGIGKKGIKQVSFVDPISKKNIQTEINDESYDEKLLRNISSETDGMFFKAETFASFESAFKALDIRENSERNFKLNTNSKSYRYFMLYLAIITLYLSFFIRTFILKEAL